MKNLFILLFMVTGLSIWSEVTINTDGSLPDNSAMLDGLNRPNRFFSTY